MGAGGVYVTEEMKTKTGDRVKIAAVCYGEVDPVAKFGWYRCLLKWREIIECRIFDDSSMILLQWRH